jgi:transcriptional regulator PpsR
MNSGFKHPENHLLRTDGAAVAAMVSAASDLTLVVGSDDVITDLSYNLDDGLASGIPAWRGQALEHVVHDNSRPLLRRMLRSARGGKPATRFDISHALQGGLQLPVQYSALPLGGDGGIVLMGRDLRPMVDLQSRLLANRQSLELNTTRQQQAEAHYRLLFETASEALVIVDPANGRVREANPRAARIFDSAGAGLAGRKFSGLFGKSSQVAVQALLARVLAVGAQDRLAARTFEDGEELLLDADLFRAGDLKLVLVRLSAPGQSGAFPLSPDSSLAGLVRDAAEAVLLTDEAGAVLWANESFLAIAQIPLAAHVVGRSLEDFFQWSGLELDVLLANVRQHGRVPQVPGTVRGALGQSADVEVSAIAMLGNMPPGYGFVMRRRAGDDALPAQPGSDLTRTAGNLVEMIGHVPMKDLVRDTTDVIERMCIEAALKLTGNNRASAARVLGLSRQALYLKLHRYGIDGGDDE